MVSSWLAFKTAYRWVEPPSSRKIQHPQDQTQTGFRPGPKQKARSYPRGRPISSLSFRESAPPLLSPWVWYSPRSGRGSPANRTDRTEGLLSCLKNRPFHLFGFPFLGLLVRAPSEFNLFLGPLGCLALTFWLVIAVNLCYHL